MARKGRGASCRWERPCLDCTDVEILEVTLTPAARCHPWGAWQGVLRSLAISCNCT